MSEPYLPLPDPGPNDYWEPEPAHCPECGVIIDARPKGDGWEGWCPEHGVVPASYRDSQEAENREEEA